MPWSDGAGRDRALIPSPAGEQGKVDESMREMAAIEALKTEKADKEVCNQRSSSMQAADRSTA